jgi:hypothetical protein
VDTESCRACSVAVFDHFGGFAKTKRISLVKHHTSLLRLWPGGD